MNTAFVDTSAFYSLLVQNDARHVEARGIAAKLELDSAALVTSSFVVHETVALLQSRLGLEAVDEFREAFLPLLDVVWVDAEIFALAMAALLAARSRRISLTDWSSFVIMRHRAVEFAFAFDQDFTDQGFKLARP